MPQTSRRALFAAFAMVAGSAGGAFGQAAAPVRVRGSIAALAGDVLTVTARDGAALTLKLTEPLVVVSLRRVALADITPGTALGAVAAPGPDGTLRAIAITVLPPGARITELQVPWDLGDNSSMNNGPVEAIAEASSGRMLTLSILGRSVALEVTPETPLLMPVPAARADLVPGAAVFINAVRGTDGALATTRITVGKDGVVPAI